MIRPRSEGGIRAGIILQNSQRLDPLPLDVFCVGLAAGVIGTVESIKSLGSAILAHAVQMPSAR